VFVFCVGRCFFWFGSGEVFGSYGAFFALTISVLVFCV